MTGGVVAVCVGGLVVGVVWGLTHLAPPGPTGETTTMPVFSVGAAVQTLVYCSLIALFAVIFALPAAWCMRKSSWGWMGVLCVPLLLPSYLGYAGWGVLRGPGTQMGDWLARHDQQWTLLAGNVIAVMGLALWAFPMAALAIGVAARRIPETLLESLRLEAASPVRRGTEVLRLLLPGVVLGGGAVWMVMIGSAVPLHLAQVQTLAIHLWKYMSLTPEPIWAWVGAWPLLGLAAAGAVVGIHVFSRRSSERPTLESEHRSPPPWWVQVAAAAVWVLAVLVPVALNLMTLRDWSLVWMFWSGSWRAIVNSLQTASLTGLLVALVCVGIWRLASERSRSARALARWLAGVLTAFALTPGILIGAAGVALSSATWFPVGLTHTNAVLVLVHVARFGAWGAIAGLWLAGQEAGDDRDSRELYSPGVSGWLTTQVLPSWSVPVGVGLAAGALSIHEIEATVLVAPPGGGNLAQRLLDLLHYARDQQLAAATINMTAVSIVLALASGWLISRASIRSTHRQWNSHESHQPSA